MNYLQLRSMQKLGQKQAAQQFFCAKTWRIFQFHFQDKIFIGAFHSFPKNLGSFHHLLANGIIMEPMQDKHVRQGIKFEIGILQLNHMGPLIKGIASKPLIKSGDQGFQPNPIGFIISIEFPLYQAHWVRLVCREPFWVIGGTLDVIDGDVILL